MIFSVYSLSGKTPLIPKCVMTGRPSEADIQTPDDMMLLAELNDCAVYKVSRKAELGSDFDVIELQDEPQ